MNPTTKDVLLREEVNITFSNGSGDGKAYCDTEDIFLWLKTRQDTLHKQILALMPEKIVDADTLKVSADKPVAEIYKIAQNQTIDDVTKILKEYFSCK